MRTLSISSSRCLIVGATLCLLFAAGSACDLSPRANAEAVADKATEGADHTKPGDDAGAPGHETGVPLDAKPDLMIWSIVVFVIFILVLRLFAWGPLRDGLDNRESRLRQELADAEAARRSSEAALSERMAKLEGVQDEVREILAEARRDADVARQNIVEEARTEAQATQRRAIAEIERAKDQALDELFSKMNAQVARATEYVVGRSLNDGDQHRLIDDALGQFSQQQST